MTEDFSYASGFAELYERFCNRIGYFGHPIWAEDYMNRNKEKNGYYFHPDEKILSYDEALNSCNRIKNYFSFISKDIPSLKKKALDSIVQGKYVGVPMTCLDGSDKIFVDPRALLRVTRSGGMVSGNTLNEALVQGISELLEHEVSSRVYANFDKLTYYALNLNNIKNPGLQEKINNILNLGYKLYLIDLSYNYNFPVMMSVLVNPERGTIKLNFGSFPVFEIATERVITELYQGIDSFSSNNELITLRTPYKTADVIQINNVYGNSIDGSIFPIEFFTNLKYKENYNTQVFIDNNLSNNDFIQYYIDLMHNTPGMKFYFIDNSLCNEMYAIQIIIEHDERFELASSSEVYLYNFDWNELNIKRAEHLVDQYMNFLKQLRKNQVNIPDLIAFLQTCRRNNSTVENYIASIFLWNMAHIQAKGGLFDSVMTLLDIQFTELDVISVDTIHAENDKEYKKYILLNKYLKTNKYNKEELYYIFNTIFNYNITEEDINKSLSIAYLLQKTYIEPLYKYIDSEEYNNLINTYIN